MPDKNPLRRVHAAITQQGEAMKQLAGKITGMKSSLDRAAEAIRVEPRSKLYVKLLWLKYSQTENPLYVWEAYRECRRNGYAPPDFVYEYLDHVAHELCEMDNPGPKEAAPQIMAVLGFKTIGAGTQFKRKQTFEKKLKIAMEASARLEAEQEKPEAQRQSREQVFTQMALDIDRPSHTCPIATAPEIRKAYNELEEWLNRTE